MSFKLLESFQTKMNNKELKKNKDTHPPSYLYLLEPWLLIGINFLLDMIHEQLAVPVPDVVSSLLDLFNHLKNVIDS